MADAVDPSPLDEIYAHLGDQIQARLTAASPGRPADLSPIAAQLLALPPRRIDRPADAARLLHLLGFLSGQPGLDGRRAWQWAKRVAIPHHSSADVLGLLGSLGDGLRQADPAAADAIATGELADLFRRSMALAPTRATAFGRAGLFFLHQADDAQAERCLARAFELDPTSGFVARQLADLYAHDGRPADGMAVLDQCLASLPVDAPDPEVLWAAGLAAIALARPDAAASHFARLERADPDRKWAAYYRAVALLDLGRFAEAAAAIEREAGVIQMRALHVDAVRAAAAAGVGDTAAVRRHADAAARTPLSTVTYLPRDGVVGCFTRLWAAVEPLADDDTVRSRVRERLLASGLTPARFWDSVRGPGAGSPTPFWCDLRQPLDETWSAAGHAMPGTEAWPAYRIRYGVLAADAAEAAAHALAWQRRSADLDPTVESVTPGTDPAAAGLAPGVWRRGYPERAD